MAKDSKTRSLQTKTKVQEKKNQILTANGKRLENLTPAENGKILEKTRTLQALKKGLKTRPSLTEIVIGQKTKPLQTMAKGQKTQPLQKNDKSFFFLNQTSTDNS